MVALTRVLLAHMRSLQLDEWAVQSLSAHSRTTSFRHTTSVRTHWVSKGARPLRPLWPRLANEQKRSGKTRYQVYHLHSPGGPPSGLLLVRGGLHGSGKSQGRGMGDGCVEPPESWLCFFRFVTRAMRGSVGLMLCSLPLTCICISRSLARLELERISYQLPTTSDDQAPMAAGNERV